MISAFIQSVVEGINGRFSFLEQNIMIYSTGPTKQYSPKKYVIYRIQIRIVKILILPVEESSRGRIHNLRKSIGFISFRSWKPHMLT